LKWTVILNITANHGVPDLGVFAGTTVENHPGVVQATKFSKHKNCGANSKDVIDIVSTVFKKKPIKHKSGCRMKNSGEDIDESDWSWRERGFDEGAKGAKSMEVSVGLDEPGNQGVPSDDVSFAHNVEQFEDVVVLGLGGERGQARGVHVQEGVVDNSGVGLGAKEVAMKGLAGDEVLGEGAGLHGGREGVPIGSRVPPPLHFRV